MKVERDECSAEFDGSSILIQFPENVECTERQLDNSLQFIMLQLGIDVKHMDPPDPEPEVKVPAEVGLEPVPADTNVP